jgi:hypothetical protein
VEEKEYLGRLCEGVGRVLRRHEIRKLRQRIRSLEDTNLLEEELHPIVKEVLASAGHLEDILKYARCRHPDPAVWRDASDWSEAVFRAAYLMVLEDMRDLLFKAVIGRLPAGALAASRGRL